MDSLVHDCNKIIANAMELNHIVLSWAILLVLEVGFAPNMQTFSGKLNVDMFESGIIYEDNMQICKDNHYASFIQTTCWKIFCQFDSHQL